MSRNRDYSEEVAQGLETGIFAPVKGLNTSVPLAGMKQDYAQTLDNWICQPDALVTRLGALDHATGFSQAPKSLMGYFPGTATGQMFAAANNGIFNVTTAGAIGAAVAALTQGDVRHVNFGTSAGQFLYVVNGVDAPWHYNGTTWVNPAITGITSASSLTCVESYRSRLYFIAENELGFRYLPPDSVAGAATLFNIGSSVRRGGKAMGIATWTIDGGDGSEDRLIIATSQGELIVFSGGDPSSPSDWQRLGVWYAGKPIGRNCFEKLGGDVLYLSESGIIPMSRLMQTVAINYKESISRNIEPSIMSAAQLYGNQQGWEITLYPKASLLILNVPMGLGQSIQYVMHTQSAGWSRFTDWNANAFLDFNGTLFFAGARGVSQAFVGTSDYGDNITFIMDTAYSRFGTRRQLQPELVRVLLGATGPVNYQLGFATDFSDEYYMQGLSVGNFTAGVWDSGLWDQALWGSAFQLQKNWQTVAAKGGISISCRLLITTKSISCLVIALDYKFARQGLVS